ncbi:unnamed protein product [Cuscuta campestris]|uniref:Uncharacterized protein n=1 Tax=Cuscuta campestris TaxID=132261 RepID=A0A484L0A0_9ASTE|nr:unnamed protein product [Cuscuta campestris]
MGSGKAQSGKKTKKKVPKSPRKKGAEEDATKVSSLATDVAMQDLEKERAQTASSSSATSPPSVEVVPDIAPQVDTTSAQNTPQVLDKMPEPEKVAAKPVTFADLFKGNRDPDQGMILKQYDVGEGVLHIPDSVIKQCWASRYLHSWLQIHCSPHLHHVVQCRVSLLQVHPP